MLSDKELDQIWIHTMPNDTMSILRAVAEAAVKQALEDAANAKRVAPFMAVTGDMSAREVFVFSEFTRTELRARAASISTDKADEVTDLPPVDSVFDPAVVRPTRKKAER